MNPKHLKMRGACPGCGGRDTRVVYERPYTDPDITAFLKSHYEPQGMVELEHVADGMFTVARCSGCEMVYQVWEPDDFLAERIYEHWINPKISYDTLEGVREMEHYRCLGEEVLTLLFWLGRAQTQELKFLDFGMGWSLWCRMAMGYGVDAYGAELSEARIAHGKRFGVKVVTWDELPRHKFDAINTEQVFEHLGDPLGTLRYLTQAMSPQGLIKISVPDAPNFDERLGRLNWHAHRDALDSPMPIQPLEHLRLRER